MRYNKNNLKISIFKKIILKGRLNSMNKGEFIKAMAEKTGFTQKDAAAAYDAFVATVTDALKAGDKVSLVGFGTFEVKEVAAKTGINPQTKEPVQIPASKKPVMKFGKAYKDMFN